MTDIKLTGTSPAEYTAEIVKDDMTLTIVNATATVVPYVAPVVVDVPPPVDVPPVDKPVDPPAPPDPPAPDPVSVAFTATLSAAGVIVVKDRSLNVPDGATGSVNFGDNYGVSSIRAGGSSASYGYKKQGSFVITLKWKSPEGVTYSAIGTAIYDGAAHAVTSDPGTTVTAGPPPPPAKAPVPAPGQPPAQPAPPIPAVEPPLPPAPPADKAHTVIVTATDPTGPVWTAQATVGEDWTVAGAYLYLRNAAGEAHPGLTAKIYSDCVDVGADRGDNGSSYLGWGLKVSYDGVVVHDLSPVNFYRGTLNKTLRYGPQAPWHAVDPSLFPNWAKGSPTLSDLSKFDYSYNGMGTATTKGMASTGDRPDIGYVIWTDIPFCVNPSDEAFASVRKTADNDGACNICFRDPNTGQPYDITKYPNATMASYDSGVYKGNPIVRAAGLSGAVIAWDEAHQTGYAFVAAAATDSARDKDHAAIHANAVLTAFNPVYRQQTGFFGHYQERGVAWGLRSLFLGAHVSSIPDYFAGQLEIQRKFAMARDRNPLNFMASYVTRDSVNGPSTSVAVWEENFVRIVISVIAKKQAEWMDYATYLASALPMLLGRTPDVAPNLYPVSTNYAHVIKAADNSILPNATALYEATLRDNKWAANDITAALDLNCSMDTMYALLKKYGFTNKEGDLMQYVAAPGAYPAIMRAAVASAYDLGIPYAKECWALMESLPTKPVYGADWRFNIVPRASA